MDRLADHDTPLKLAHGANERLVVVYSPKGERIVLSAAAALTSARVLMRAGQAAAREAERAGNVVAVRFDRLRRIPQRRWQTLRGVQRSQPLRWLVALMLLPVGLALGTAGAMFAAVALLSKETALGIGLFLPLVGLLLAVPLSWLIAPLAMSREERACRPLPGSRPQLVANNDFAGS